MLNLKISKRQASPADLRLSRQSARFEDLLRRTDKDALIQHEAKAGSFPSLARCAECPQTAVELLDLFLEMW